MPSTVILNTATATTASPIVLADGSSHLLFINCAGEVPADAVYDLHVVGSLGPTRVLRIRGDEGLKRISGPVEYHATRVSNGRAGTPTTLERF